MKTVSVNWTIGRNLATCQFFVNAQSPDFPWSLYFNKFYTFQPLSRSQWNMYEFVWRIYIYWLKIYENHMVVWWRRLELKQVLITYTFWEQFVIRLCTSMILFKTGDLIPLIIKEMHVWKTLILTYTYLKETFIYISHTFNHFILCDCEVTI